MIVILALFVAIDGAVLWTRVSRTHIQFPATNDGATWVFVGSDSRAALPSGPHLYGSVAQAPGTHADAVLVVHRGPTGYYILSIPRDILVSPAPGQISRLTLTFNQGPQQLVDGLCRSLGIPATHLVVITMKGFAAAIDDLGGVTIQNPAPVRDPYSGLNLPRPGPVHLDGVQVLALVRSRMPQTLTATGWVPASTAAGDGDRTHWVGAMFNALAAKAHAARDDPFTLQSTAWDLTGALTIDQRTSLVSLMDLSLKGAHTVDLPVHDLSASGIGATADAATFQALSAAGFGQTCR